MVFGFISNLIFGDQGNKNDQELILFLSFTVNQILLIKDLRLVPLVRKFNVIYLSPEV